jgi:hypothetical protein
MDTKRANPVISTYTSYRLIAQDIPKSLERIASQPQVARESEHYLSRISEIKSIDEFMADTRVFAYAMKAHGLEDMSYAKAFMRKVLTEGTDDDSAFANKLADSKYREFAETFNFAKQGAAATIFGKAQQGTVDKYHRLTLEEEAGADNTGVRLALYFERTAPELHLGLRHSCRQCARRCGAHRPGTSIGTGGVRHRQAGRPDQIAHRYRGFQGSGQTWQVPRSLHSALGAPESFRRICGFEPSAWLVVRLRHHPGTDAVNQQSQAWRPLMQGSLYVALSSQIALERRMNTLADNVANANTTGFRATEIKFNEVLADTGADNVSFVNQGEDFLSSENGGLRTTGSQLDFAIRGEAWFMVETPSGNMLTRDGRFYDHPGRRTGQYRWLSGA